MLQFVLSHLTEFLGGFALVAGFIFHRIQLSKAKGQGRQEVLNEVLVNNARSQEALNDRTRTARNAAEEASRRTTAAPNDPDGLPNDPYLRD